MVLYMFYGTECVHCHEMTPLVEKLEKEENLSITRLETWHNSANAKKLQNFDKGRCGGVPYFYNDTTGKFICGSTTYDKLKAWAIGK